MDYLAELEALVGPIHSTGAREDLESVLTRLVTNYLIPPFEAVLLVEKVFLAVYNEGYTLFAEQEESLKCGQ